MSIIIVGIDPGLDGAVAVYTTAEGGKLLYIFDMPTVEVVRGGSKKRRVSGHLLSSELSDVCITYGQIRAAYLEQVSARPREAASAAFAFGRGVGVIEGVLATLDIPISDAPPATWTRAMGVKGGKEGAVGSRARAIDAFPEHARLFARKKDDGRADAALIAKYGSRNHA